MTTRFRLEPKVQLVGGGFLFSKTDIGGSSGGFASPKPEQPEPDRSYKKIRSNPAKTSQIRRDLDQIQRDLKQIWLYLVGFSQIQPNPTICSEKKNAYFRKNLVFGENFPVFGEIFQIPTRISSFRQKFQILATLFSNFDAFLNSNNRSDPTDANQHRKPNRPIFLAVGFGLLCPSTRRRRVESGMGRKPTRLDP